jgi:subtilase family serine protease
VFKRTSVLVAAAAMVFSGVAGTAAASGQHPAKDAQLDGKFSAAARMLGAIADPAHRAAATPATSSPKKLIDAYNVKPLWDKGIDGAGRTVTTVVSYGDKNIKSYIDAYDKRNGLPAADVRTIEPAGKVPGCNDPGVDTATCQGWGGETDLDVAMIHTLAPKAKIVVAATPTAETQGAEGFPDMMKAIDDLADKKATDVISMSLGTVEQDFANTAEFRAMDSHFAKAASAGITVVASTGDDGVSGSKADGTPWKKRVATWPASEPAVTAVGGTELHLDSAGKRTAPDSEINFSGAGVSSAYPVPDWQTDVAKSTGAKNRSYPDISLEGTSGTSESAPLFGALVALTAQQAGKPVGQINPALYALGAKAGLVDVTTGDNTYNGVKGYRAGEGFDINSGWGTLDAAKFVPALAKAVTAGK